MAQAIIWLNNIHTLSVKVYTLQSLVKDKKIIVKPCLFLKNIKFKIELGLGL